MSSVSIFIFSLLPALLSTTLARPLEERQFQGTSNVIWADIGPDVRDIKQLVTLNCWWAACSLSVLMSSQAWVEHIIKHADGTSLVGAGRSEDSALQVSLWNPNDGSRFTHTAQASLRSPTEDRATENWWHDAVSQTVCAMGTHDSVQGILPTGQFADSQGSAVAGLKILTGYEGASHLKDNYRGVEAFKNDLARASTGTPVIFNTVAESGMGETTPQLGHSHDYAVYNVSQNSEGKDVVWARNSWGSTDAFLVEDVYANSYQILHLANWDVLGIPSADVPPPDNTDVVPVPAQPTANPSATDSAAAGPDASATSSAAATAPLSSSANPASVAPAASSDVTAPANSAPAASAPGNPYGGGGQGPAPGGEPAAVQNSVATAAATTAAPSAAGSGGPFQWTSTLPFSSWTLPMMPIARDVDTSNVGAEATD